MSTPRPNPKHEVRPMVRRAADVFRTEIEKAQAEGHGLNEMLLRLTLGDESELKRDRLLAVEDISFKGGVMRFLGVKVAAGGIGVSRLDIGKDARGSNEKAVERAEQEAGAV